MRFYKVFYPGRDSYSFCTSIHALPKLPEGTTVYAVVTDRSGHETDSWSVPVVNGRAQAHGHTLYGKGTIRRRRPGTAVRSK